MESVGCLKDQEVDNNFKKEFLDSKLISLLPDGYDVCYSITPIQDMHKVQFYLYDSSSPMNDFDFNYVIGSITLYIDQGEDDEINISSLSINSELNEFNLRKAGFGSYLMMIAISYAKSFDIKNIKLDDMSDGYRTEHNIYKKIGLEYEDDYGGPEMVGLIDDIFSNLDNFLSSYKTRIVNKLNELTEYFDDEEWEYDMEDEEWEYDSDDEEMEMDGGVGTPPYNRGEDARDRWLSDMRRRFQESVQAGQPNMELAQTIMINTPIDPTTVRAIPMTGPELRRQERRQRRTLGRNTRPSISEQTVLPSHYTERTPLVARLLQPGEDINHMRMMRAELVEKRDSLDSPPDSPDRRQHRKEAARDIQRRFRGNRQRRKLTKRRPRYGKMVEPATRREQIRRWMDLSNQFDQDDPVKGYLNPFTKKGGKSMKKCLQKGGRLETIEEEDYCCDELDRCKNDNKRNKRLVNTITKLYEDELMKQMNRGGSKRTMKKTRGGMLPSSKQRTAARTRRQQVPQRSDIQEPESENYLGEMLLQQFENEEDYLFPDNPSVQVNEEDLGPIDIYDMPVEVMGNIADNLEFDNCEELRNYCLINPRECAMDVNFRDKYEYDLKNCKIEAKIKKSSKRFFQLKPDPGIFESMNDMDGSNSSKSIGDGAIRTIEHGLPIPRFAGKMLREILKEQGLFNELQKKIGKWGAQGKWGAINISFMELVLYFHSENPELLMSTLNEWVNNILNNQDRLEEALKNNFMQLPEPVDENWLWNDRGDWLYSKWLYEASEQDILLLQTIVIDAMYNYLLEGNIYGLSHLLFP